MIYWIEGESLEIFILVNHLLGHPLHHGDIIGMSPFSIMENMDSDGRMQGT